VNSKGDLIFLKEGETAPPGFIGLPEIPNRFAEGKEPLQVTRNERRLQAKRAFGKSRFQSQIASLNNCPSAFPPLASGPRGLKWSNSHHFPRPPRAA
jgi:hypothetical protein